MIKSEKLNGLTKAAFTVNRLDILKSSELLSEMSTTIDETDETLSLDTSELEFIDSAILGVFVRIHDVASKAGKKLVFTNLSPYIENMFLNTRMDKLFNIE